MTRFALFSLCCIFFLIAQFCEARQTDASSELSFARDVQPILAQHCYACHGADEESRAAGLRLDIREEAIDMGAIDPDSPEDSELLARIHADDDESVMPPISTKKPLSREQKEVLEKWIRQGAGYEKHWAFQAPRHSELPKVKNESWCQNEIDYFILAQLEKAGLSPAEKCRPEKLFRRFHLDITGLPPKEKDLDAFLVDFEKDPKSAISRWIDRLMDRPAWGEHRARYWLDAARYADTHGLHYDNYREIWPYRDWVIRAFNNNQPFDEFTIDQLAGDLRENPTRDQLIATGFQRCNMTTNEGGTIAEENLALYASDRVQTFGWVYLGLTTNCCQCHDHKFDPLTMKDYYSLAAYFRNTVQNSHDGNTKDGRGPTVKVFSETDLSKLSDIDGRQQDLQEQLQRQRAKLEPEFVTWLIEAKLESFGLPDSDKLTLHLPLNEGDGNELTNLAQADSPVVAEKVKWNKEGVIGSAPRVNNKHVPILGDYGQLDFDQPFTVALWVRCDKTNGSTPIIARMNDSKSHRGWDIYREGDKYVVHMVDSWPGNSLKIKTKKATVKPKIWQHVAVTYDGSRNLDQLKIYVDGSPQEIEFLNRTLQEGATLENEVPLKIGQRSGGSVFNGGSVQDIRFYSVAINAENAAKLAKNSATHALLSKYRSSEGEASKSIRKLLLERYVARNPVFTKLQERLAQNKRERDAIEKRTPITHIQKEKPNSQAMAKILMRGEYDKPGEEVQAAPPAALHSPKENAPENRMGLAQWVLDPENPLTSRVTVNRFWQELFGRGIVVTSEDFGMMGSAPTHPELLDWLALEFRDSGWNVRHIYKLMMTSATYQQAAINTPEKELADRDNQLLSRGPRFRMDAEMVRDYALAASGLLSTNMFGPGVKPYQPGDLWNIVGLPGGDTRNYVQDKGSQVYRRSVYSFWKRMAPPPNLESFNAPSREVCVVRRERTNTPLQALVTLNDPQFVEAARVLAEKALANETFEDRMNFVSRRLLCRNLTDKEMALLRQSHDELHEFYDDNSVDAIKLISVGEKKYDDKLNPVELATMTLLCNQLMNLDEVLNK